METFLGMAVEQKNKSIKIHLDNYIKDVLTEYSAYIKKSLRPKKVPISPGVVFKAEDIPDSPDPRKQKQYRSFVAKLHFAATWIWFDILFVNVFSAELRFRYINQLCQYLICVKVNQSGYPMLAINLFSSIRLCCDLCFFNANKVEAQAVR